MARVMVDQERITREFYDTLSPYEQGYASYFQADWPGAEIPKECPHEADSQAASDWRAGATMASIHVLDTEE